MNKIKLTILFSLLVLGIKAQELNCTVRVNTDKIQISNKNIFETLESSLTEFMNTTKWTDVEYKFEERIECSFLITVNKFTLPGTFETSLQITSNRPVYNSGYQSTLFKHQDNSFNFSYIENSPIIFTPNQFRSNLSSVMAYYAYIILGYNADSFSKNGGTPYFTEAQRIVNNAQNSGQTGWRSMEDTRNRFWLVDNVLQNVFQPLRDCYYQYHRMGLDFMTDDAEGGRAQVLAAVKSLEQIHRSKPLSFNMQLFFNAKFSELISIFKESPTLEQSEFIQIAKLLDPTRSSKYTEGINP